MSPKGKNKKKHHQNESSDIQFKDKQFDKKKHRKDKSSDIQFKDKQFDKKKHRKDESSNIRYKDKSSKKMKDRKDESSDIYIEDTKKKRNIDYNQQVEFVYYDPSIIQNENVFQAKEQHSLGSHQIDEVEAVDHVVEAVDQDGPLAEQEVQAINRDAENE
jgi:hypothetical protein